MSNVAQDRIDGKGAAAIRAGFVAQGTSLNAWCLAEGVKPTNAYKALAGKWTGPKATALIERLAQAARVKCQSCE